MKTWTPRLDKILLAAHEQGASHAAMARAIRRATRGSFTPHRTTCYRRLVQLEAVPRPRPVAEPEPASTRVDAIPARTRAPLSSRLPPPPVSVLALPAELVERSGVLRVVGDLLCATVPGWSWELLSPEETSADAVASARHGARLRGDDFSVLEDFPGQHPLVLVCPRIDNGRGMSARLLILVVVRFTRVVE